jgi:uncharacterized iron-regulated membrane protein
VETLNVATIAGLPLAIAAYFWANRLLPTGMAGRADWEIHTLFAVWLAALFYALARPLARAWIELCGLASAAYLAVPLLNAPPPTAISGAAWLPATGSSQVSISRCWRWPLSWHGWP